jgi:hypothetical protein
MLPENWEDYDVDPRIPDVSEWQPVQLRDFFTKKGFSDALSAVFLEQVSSLRTYIHFNAANQIYLSSRKSFL